MIDSETVGAGTKHGGEMLSTPAMDLMQERRLLAVVFFQSWTMLRTAVASLKRQCRSHCRGMFRKLGPCDIVDAAAAIGAERVQSDDGWQTAPGARLHDFGEQASSAGISSSRSCRPSTETVPLARPELEGMIRPQCRGRRFMGGVMKAEGCTILRQDMRLAWVRQAGRFGVFEKPQPESDKERKRQRRRRTRHAIA